MQNTKEKRQLATDISTVAPRTQAFLSSHPPRILLLLLTLALLALPGYAQITPSDDAYVNSASATTNYGGAATLNLSSASQTSFIRFDLTAVPSSYTGSSVAKATLKLFVNSVGTPGSFNVDMVGGTWAEKTITYSLQPAITSTIASSVPLATANKNTYIQIDVTSAVQAWLNGTAPNDGIALVANSPLSVSFTTKENTTTSHPPELDIVFYGSGAQGPQGPAGPQGIQGPQGVQGNSGPIGPAGPQGPTGSVGVVNRGTWSPSTQYQDNDTVSYGGSSWIALLPNLASAPNATNPAWQLLAAKGINNQGSWVQVVHYQVDDAVTDGGQFWIAVAPNIASEPNLLNPNWQLIAAQGPAGPQGTQGPTGSPGPVGPQGTIGPVGPQGSAGPQGPQGALGPIGPFGPAGPQGAVGPAGPIGMTNRGQWSSGVSYQANDAVTDHSQFWLATAITGGQEPIDSSPVWQLIAAKGADGAPGSLGPPGPPGPVGPQGANGANGAAGAQGPAGPQGPTGLPGTGVLNGTQDFISSFVWNSPPGVTRVIVELWGAGGGGGSCGGNILCGNPGGGGGAGAYSRSVLTVTPLTNYFVTIGSGGAQNSDGGSTQFNETGMGGTILLQAGGGRQGGDGGGFNNCYSTLPACGSGGAPDSAAPIGHNGAAGSFLTNCAPSGAAGFPIQGFPTTVGAGGSGVYTSLLKCSVTPQVNGQNGYAVLTW